MTRVPESLKRRLEAAAARDGRSTAAELRYAVSEWLAARERLALAQVERGVGM